MTDMTAIITVINKIDICNQIKNISIQDVMDEWHKLKKMTPQELSKLHGQSKVGCNFIDYFFFLHRLETIGNKGITFFDFLEKIEEYKTKKYIQHLLSYCEKNNRYIGEEKLIKKYYYCYGLCFGRINAFKITNALDIYNKYQPHSVVDPFAGFGGRLVGCLLKNIDYIGIDCNTDLQPAYDNIMQHFQPLSQSKVSIHYRDASTIDYSVFHYDMVMTSPPYYNIEIYKNSGQKKTKEQWDNLYDVVFEKTWNHLQKGGHFIININETIYNKILCNKFGKANDIIPLKKALRNKYKEFVYVWKKS